MTTPDKEEMPTDIRTGGEFWAEKRDGRWQLQMRHRGPGSSFCVAQINHWADNPEALATRIVTACNGYEPMREALAEIAEATTTGNHQSEFFDLLDHIYTVARAALKAVPQPASSSSLEMKLHTGIANIKDELNTLALCGAVPMWTSLIGRLDDLAAELFQDVNQPASEAGKISSDEVAP